MWRDTPTRLWPCSLATLTRLAKFTALVQAQHPGGFPMETTERIDQLTHIVYELVDILDAEGVAPEAELGAEADRRARLADVKLKLVELLHERTAAR